MQVSLRAVAPRVGDPCLCEPRVQRVRSRTVLFDQVSHAQNVGAVELVELFASIILLDGSVDARAFFGCFLGDLGCVFEDAAIPVLLALPGKHGKRDRRVGCSMLLPAV